ncbi:hypothetical protein [Labrenzia sp. DG1229]|uniref:hypothetical protein n=1 Tax=Labrenzia sp. DG1229 TaxID=681847 RepID=UPI00048D024C|nr:hypothetical protein [Labrenzia sp. DG1229]
MSANTKPVTLTAARKWLAPGLCGLAFSLAWPVAAQDTGWKQNLAACAGNSPFIEALLAQHNDDHRPLMRIGEMQAWEIHDETGQPTIALTTEEGLTIIGRILGPQGEDISAALLATRPNNSALNLQHIGPGGVTTPPEEKEAQTEAAVTPILEEPPTIATPAPEGTVSPSLERLLAETQEQSSTPPDMATTDGSTELGAVATAPITASAAPTPEIQAGMNAIFKEAGEERIWFSAAKPNAGAPVVYMLADPECPHCQWTIDNMRSEILSGEIDLRIIFAPITGVGGFNTSLSILHSDDIPSTFMAHMTSKTRGTEAVAQMNSNAADRAVVQGIVDNINWMRTNRMPGVPFFLYQTDEGARFAFSELPPDILTVAKSN